MIVDADMSDSWKSAAEAMRPRLEGVVALADSKVRGLIERDPGYFPMYTKAGKWRHSGETWTDWCAGFLVGLQWLLYQQTGERFWREQAENHCRLIEHKKHDQTVHDLGFIFLNSYLPWYERTGDARLQEVLITAGRTLGGRYQPKGGYIASFIGPQSLFIDIMMNVPIVFYAARETGDEALLTIARTHCRTTERTLVRPDGGTAHEGLFDAETGRFIGQSTHQGLSAESDWSRGLAWSLYGFGTVFRYTQDPADRHVAVRNADHFLERLPASGVAPWDFDAPEGPDRLDDSSASAIAASGLWQLADLVDDPQRSDRYRTATLTILDALCTDRYLSGRDPDWEGILKHGVYHMHKKLGVDESVMWGDFFLLEAVCRVLEA
jgi:unsaturated chondroitin disaccharide hydrolase